MSTRQQQIARLANKAPETVFTSLNHHLDMEWLRESYRRTRKDGAVGIDAQTAADYEAKLEENLESLLVRAKSGTYFAPPVKRVYIPKGIGTKELRPIGIPTFEDKVLQRAIVMLLEPIYEQEFLDSSFGFRPGRSQHDSLACLRKAAMSMGGGWVLSIDIRKFFDTLDKAKLRELIELRVRDGVVLRLIGKWLNAGVMEENKLHYPEAGSPQGGVVSPLASNVYLHHTLDLWFEQVVKPRLKGRAALVRFADDARIVFAREDDARRVLAVLPQRFARFGLTMHPEKTTLVDFRRPKSSGQPADQRRGTFDFLGFTHYWGKSFWSGLAIKHRTARDRLSRAIKKIDEWCRENRHKPIGEQHAALSMKLRGHYNYYGLYGNGSCLKEFRMKAVRTWRKWLNRRGGRRGISWPRFTLYLNRFPLPVPAILRGDRTAAKP